LHFVKVTPYRLQNYTFFVVCGKFAVYFIFTSVFFFHFVCKIQFLYIIYYNRGDLFTRTSEKYSGLYALLMQKCVNLHTNTYFERQ